MPGEKHPYEHLPIPSYEEATSSRPPSSQAVSNDDAERQGLLHPDSGNSNQPSRRENRPGLFSRWGDNERGNYRPPMAQSVADSDDDGLSLPSFDSDNTEDDDEALRQDIEQMEMLEPGSLDSGSRSSTRSRLSKRFSSITTTLSSLHLPTFAFPRPSFVWLTRRMPTWPEQYRPGFAIVARLFGLFVIISLVYALFVMEIIPGGRVGFGQPFNPEWVRQFAQSSIDRGRIADNLKMITKFDHVAGTEGDWSHAKTIEKIFTSIGLDYVGVLDYDVYLNYPKEDGTGRKVSIVEPKDQQWEAQLEENVASGGAAQQRQTYVFHGHSKSGTVRGPLVYANYGSHEDFETLADKGINVTGSIALVRYYGSQGDRALKVKAAEEAGAVGCIIYSDPQQDGFGRGDVWPNGRWRTKDSVQRGAVSLMSWIVGDVLTPGWPSTKDKPRIGLKNNPGLVNIPSIPLSWGDAQHLLKSLKGHGKKMGKKWHGELPAINHEWWTGDQDSPIVELQNELDEIKNRTIWNVLGVIEGIESNEKKIIIGNHRDSWCLGAVDPGSGTAVMLEVARVLALLKAQGWRPLRTIIIASWDAEEYNLIGSTEYVEDHMLDLRMNGFTYMNVDVGVSGDRFHAAGSPVFEKALLRVLNRVGDPAANQTLRDLWDQRNSELEGLGAGSDYVAFQSMAGTSSIDFGFQHKSEDDDGGIAKAGVPGFPYHSCYETFVWMQQYGDPGFLYHERLAQIWVLLILEFAQSLVAPFDFDAYVKAMPKYIKSLEKYEKNLHSRYSSMERRGNGNGKGKNHKSLDLKPLRQAVKDLEEKVMRFNTWEDRWYGLVYGGGRPESAALRLQRIARNGDMANFETSLLDLPDDESEKPYPKTGEEVEPRAQFKHIFFGPQPWSGYDVGYFPQIRDALDDGNWDKAQKAVEVAASLIDRAGQILVGA